MNITGLTTYRQFFDSLEPGSFYIEKREDNKISYCPIEYIFDIPKEAQAWNNTIHVYWEDKFTAIISARIGANYTPILHKNIVPSSGIIIEAEK